MAQNSSFPRPLIFAIVILVAGAVAFAAINPFAVVGSGYVGVVAHFGAVQDDLLGEGLHLITPIRTHVELMDARVQKVEANADASSNDLQDVTTTVALNFQIDKSKANLVYQNLGQKDQYIDNIIKPAIQESIKSTVAKYNAEQLITKRPEVKVMVLKDIKSRLGDNHLLVTDFSIVNFGFSPNFVNAIEEKQIAEQRALRAKNDLERIKTEADQNKAKADGDARAILARAQANAEAQKLLRESLSQEVLQLKAIEKWDGVMPIVTGEGSNGAFFDVAAAMKRKGASK